MSQKGWSAKGLIEVAWKRLDPPLRDELARRTGINAGNLSSMNTGQRNLTLPKAKVIAEASALSLVELGAPAELADAKSRGVLDRLEAVEAELVLMRHLVFEGFGLLDLEVVERANDRTSLQVRRIRRRGRDAR